MADLPAGLTLRPAEKRDSAAIHRLIWKVGINPMSLHWRRFLVVVGPRGELVGCGQIKLHGDGSHELASIAVQPQWRRKGIGRIIVERLLEGHPLPLYLTCRGQMEPFYHPYGFQSIPPATMPPYFLRIWRLYKFLKILVPGLPPLLVMRKPSPDLHNFVH